MTEFGTDQHKVNAPKHSAAHIIYSRQEEIINGFLFRLSHELEHAKTENKSILVDTIPNFLVNLAQALAPNDGRELASAHSSIAAEHGGERVRLTNFSPEDIIREYQILRDCIFETLKKQIQVTLEERKIINSSLDKALTEAMSAYFLVLNKLKERIALFVTQEIQRPLNTISAKTLLIKRNPDRKEWTAQLAENILSEVEKIHSMLLELNDPMPFKNTEKLRLSLEEGDYHQILLKAIQRLKLRYGDRFLYEGRSLKGYWNEASLSRAFESLCAAILNCDGQDQVEIKLEQVHERVLVSIHNASKFIPVDQQEILFQTIRRDQRLPGKKNVGLPLARGVAEAHGGNLSVDSSHEKGTTFFIDILIDSRPYQPTTVSPGAELSQNDLSDNL
jgi:K+-sensing histidine kinase KdpD